MITIMLLLDLKTTSLNQTKFYHTSLYPLPENSEPSSIRQAMQHSHWRQAIFKELNALIRNGTWSLVPPPVNHNIVDCK